MRKKNGQVDRLHDYLLERKNITRLDAWNELGIAELSARVIEMERRFRIAISRERIKVQNRFGEFISVTKYSYPSGQLI